MCCIYTSLLSLVCFKFSWFFDPRHCCFIILLQIQTLELCRWSDDAFVFAMSEAEAGCMTGRGCCISLVSGFCISPAD
jgi:hypothetical protein